MICGLQIEKLHTIYDSGLVHIQTPGGVWYEVTLAQELTPKTPTVIIYHHITDKTQSLYGFQSMVSRQVFKDLITVPGVGCKGVCKLLRACYPDIIGYIANKDVKSLVASKGVGKKTAEKIVEHLYTKYESSKDSEDVIVQSKEDSSQIDEVVLLVSKACAKLGYTGVKVKTTALDIIGKDVKLADLKANKVNTEDYASHIFRYTYATLRQG